MWRIISSNYATYIDDVTRRRESHAVRLLASFAVALLLSSFVSSATSAHTMMATGFTIFAGFVYGALFSPHAMGGADLPRPLSETDRIDLERLRKLVADFRVRSIYFIAVAIVEIILLTCVSFSYSIPKEVPEIVGNSLNHVPVDYWAKLRLICDWTEWTLSLVTPAFIVFLFLEGLYAFFRLSTAMVEIVKTRQEYLENRHV